jgi:hypothetical protein
MTYFRNVFLRPVAFLALVLSSISNPVVAFAAPAATVDADSVVVQKVDLNSGKTEYFALKATELLDEKGQIKVAKDQFDGVITRGKIISKDQIQRWNNVHSADLSRGVQASIGLSDGSQVPLKKINQISSEVLRVSPEGAVAKEVKWSIEHEADLARGEQSWFWLGFFVGGFSFLALHYIFTPHVYAAPYYYGVYRCW